MIVLSSRNKVLISSNVGSCFGVTFDDFVKFLRNDSSISFQNLQLRSVGFLFLFFSLNFDLFILGVGGIFRKNRSADHFNRITDPIYSKSPRVSFKGVPNTSIVCSILRHNVGKAKLFKGIFTVRNFSEMLPE